MYVYKHVGKESQLSCVPVWCALRRKYGGEGLEKKGGGVKMGGGS